MLTDTKFEQWSESERRGFVGAFRDAFNVAEESNYQLFDESMVDDSDYDFRLKDPETGDVLKVQHTFGGADAQTEYVQPKIHVAVIERLKELLGDLRGIFVSITFSDGLEMRRVDEVANKISLLVRAKADVVLPEGLALKYSYDKDESSIVEPIKPFVENIEVIGNQRESVMFGFSARGGAVMPDDMRAAMAVEKKESAYADPSDLVLLVHFNKLPLADAYEPIIAKKIGGTKFRGVWIYDGYDGSFHRVK